MKELVIDITAQGEAQAMHFDEFPLGYLGPMKITRASEIKFNTVILISSNDMSK